MLNRTQKSFRSNGRGQAERGWRGAAEANPTQQKSYSRCQSQVVAVRLRVYADCRLRKTLLHFHPLSPPPPLLHPRQSATAVVLALALGTRSKHLAAVVGAVHIMYSIVY